MSATPVSDSYERIPNTIVQLFPARTSVVIQAEIQRNLFYDYRTNVDSYPKWQAWMREKRPRLLVFWGKYDLSFDLGEPERYRQDVPNAEVHVLDGGHFAIDTAADEMAAWVGNFMAVSPLELSARSAALDRHESAA
jgi:pimeloyl-ACP methyl ester carboxylesterase